MLNTKALLRAAIAGTVLQVAMVVAGHFNAYIAAHVFMLGGMGISLLAGFLHGRAATAWSDALAGGTLAGAICALIGIAISVALGDTATNILLLGTVSSAVTGLFGGLIGKLVGGTHTAVA